MKRFAVAMLLTIVAAHIASAEPNTEHPSKQVFDRYCASCHGIEGKGDGPAAAALDPRPTDLTLLARNNGGEFPALKVAEAIFMEGRTMIKAHGTASMPVWGKKLSEQPESRGPVMDLASLTNYLRSIQQK